MPIRWDRGADGIVLLTLDAPDRSANTMNAAFAAALEATVDRLVAERDDTTGVIISSAKRTFFAGGDLRDLRELRSGPRSASPGLIAKAQLRRLERYGRPVVAVIAGAALGGGLELALAAHHRIVVDDPAIQLGLPEVTLGLLPGGGGIVRTVRMLGLSAALDQVLLPGTRLTTRRAGELGLVDRLVASPDRLVPTAAAWIAAHPSAAQPWDVQGHRIPGGVPDGPEFGAELTAALFERLAGAPYPAPHHILAAAVEGAQVGFDAACEIENRYSIALATGQVAKNMIQVTFFDQRRVGRSPVKGLFAERVTERFTDEAARMVAAGVPAPSIEQAAGQAGFTSAPTLDRSPGPGPAAEVAFGDLKERLLFAVALEAVRCLDEGVVGSVAEANVGSLLGVGFPRWTGGALQYVNAHDGGPPGFAARARELAAAYGDRFAPPPSLAARTTRYADPPA